MYYTMSNIVVVVGEFNLIIFLEDQLKQLITPYYYSIMKIK